MLHLTEAGNRGEGADAVGHAMLAREFDVAGEVVGQSGATNSFSASNRARGDHELNLAEGAARRNQGLAHILENSCTSRSDQSGNIRTGGRHGADHLAEGRSSVSSVVGVELFAAVSNSDVITGVRGDLFGSG